MTRTIEKKDQNFRWQFNVEEGWFATIPRSDLVEVVPDEEYRVYVGETCLAGKVTRELIQRLCEAV